MRRLQECVIQKVDAKHKRADRMKMLAVKHEMACFSMLFVVHLSTIFLIRGCKTFKRASQYQRGWGCWGVRLSYDEEVSWRTIPAAANLGVDFTLVSTARWVWDMHSFSLHEKVTGAIITDTESRFCTTDRAAQETHTHYCMTPASAINVIVILFHSTYKL